MYATEPLTGHGEPLWAQILRENPPYSTE